MKRIYAKIPQDLRIKTMYLGIEMTGKRRSFGELLRLAIDHALECDLYPEQVELKSKEIKSDSTILDDEYYDKLLKVMEKTEKKLGKKTSINNTVKLVLYHFINCPNQRHTHSEKMKSSVIGST